MALEQQLQELKKSTSNTESNELTNTDTEQYLVIKEWGVKFRINEGIKGTFYVLNGNEARFSTETFAALDKYCDPRLKDGDSSYGGLVGTLVRGRQEDRVGNMTAAEWDPAGKTINGYYYYFLNAQSPCTENHTNEELSFSQNFKNALKTLQAD